MKRIKVKDHTIYQILHANRGEFAFINFRPTKAELKAFCKKEWEWSTGPQEWDEYWEETKHAIIVSKINLWTK